MVGSNDEHRETIRLRIVAAREKKGWTPAKAAKEIGVWEKTYRRWEAPREKKGTVPNIVQAALIAKAFGVTLDWLAGRRMTRRQQAVAVVHQTEEDADDVLRRVDQMMRDLAAARAVLTGDDVKVRTVGKVTGGRRRSDRPDQFGESVTVPRESAS
jgi:transcriptional regulator with XRE-family HTH domain